MALQEEIDARRREIQTEGFPMSIGELISLYEGGDLDIHPEFQRFYRWSDRQKSRLIESLLLGIPIPSLFINQRQDAVWDVIDGLQRLSTIFEFVGVLRDEDGELLPGSELVGTDNLESLAGKYWGPDQGADYLTATQQRIIKRTALDLKIVKRESDPKAQLDLFERLNTGGSQLSDQELRNSLLILVDRTFYQWLLDLQKNQDFQTTIAASDKAIQEQYDLELILRFFALYHADEGEIRGIDDMEQFLTRTSRAFAQDESFDRDEQAKIFAEVFALLNSALGDNAFRRYDDEGDRFLGGFSVSAYEATTTGLARNRRGWNRLSARTRESRLHGRVAGLWQEQTFRDYAKGGVRASSRIARTIPFARDYYKP
jgi:hypothetical protein